MEDKDQIKAFIEKIYKDKPADQYILIWPIKLKQTLFTQSIKEAVEYTAKHNKDVYIGCGLSDKDYGKNKRCPSNKISGIPGLYIDIDYQHAAHKKLDLPPDINSAIKLLDDVKLKPTIIISSGHGIQAWWLFDEIWMFANSKERKAAAEMTERMNKAVQQVAATRGWTVDSTFDLARIYRIPGTFNCKDVPVKAEIIDINGPRHDLIDVQEHLDQNFPEIKNTIAPPPSKPIKGNKSAATIKVKKLKLDPNAGPSLIRLENAMQNSVKFKQTWNRKRNRELKSASEYDMSLANLAVAEGWDDQEIANLIIAFRRKWNLDIKKLMRKDYISGTIAKAKKNLELSNANDETEISRILACTGKYEKEDVRRAASFKIWKTIYELDIIKVEAIVDKVEPKNTIWIVTTTNNKYTFSAESFLKYSEWKIQIAAVEACLLNKNKNWDVHLKILMNVRTEKVLTLESIPEMLKEYINQTPNITPVQSLENQYPFYDGAYYYVYLEKFLSFINYQKMRFDITSKILPFRLRELGIKNMQKLILDDNNKWKNRRVWQIPPAIFSANDIEENQTEKPVLEYAEGEDDI